MDLSECFSLKGKVAVISGGAGVLCSEIAKAIGECGGKVVILDISEEAMKGVSEELTQKNIEHLIFLQLFSPLTIKCCDFPI